jgi:hypothetical protein
MKARNSENNVKWENWTNFFLGALVLVTPWIFADGFKSDAVNARMWNLIMIGLIVMISSRLAIKRLVAWAEWLSLCAGVYLIFSPWFLLYSDYPLLLWSSLTLGILISFFSALTIPIVERRMKFKFIRHKMDDDEHFLLKH